VYPRIFVDRPMVTTVFVSEFGAVAAAVIYY